MEVKISPLFKLRNYIIDNKRDREKYLLGRVMTIVDASISDAEQRKGIKDLIKSEFYTETHRGDIESILLEFVEKFAKDQAPKTSGEEDAFRGQIGISNESPVAPSYF